jgi:hypothetical protein
VMSSSPNHYGFCCAGSQCVQRNRHVTLLMICSICGNAIHQSCGNNSGDSSLICFSCLGIDCAWGPEEVAYLKIANDLAVEFCIEESSDGANFQPASFPSNDDIQFKSPSVAGISGDLASDFCLEESSDGVHFQPASFPSNHNVQLKSSSVAGISGDLASEFCLEESSDVVNFQSASFPSNRDMSCAMQHPDQVVHSTDEAPPTLNSSNFGGTEVLCLSKFSVGAVPDASVHGRSGISVQGHSSSGRG